MRNEAQQQKEEIQAKQVSFKNESKTLKNYFLYSLKILNMLMYLKSLLLS
jgi:hypothetical protein